jgi:glutaminyl-peptide cyclotransferase
MAQAVVVVVVVGLLVTGAPPFADNDGQQVAGASAAGSDCPGGVVPRPRSNRVDGRFAFSLLREQVRLGPRPAGSTASRRLARRLRRLLPGGRYQEVPGGLRNVVGSVRGRDPSRVVVVGAHYDTKDIPGFVGANDGAGGTAAVVALARSARPRTFRPTLVFILFDGEESPAGTPDHRFEEEGLRGSKVAAQAYSGAEAMVLLDFVADRRLRIRRERNSDEELWSRLRRAAAAVGVACAFPGGTQGRIADDHLPFIEQGVRAIDLIDFEFPCWHRRCDDMTAVSRRSLDGSAEAVRRMLASL